MLGLVIGMAMAAGPGDQSARAQFSSCLKMSVEKGASDKIEAAGFASYAKQNCSAQSVAFRASAIAYAMKAGWTHKKAEADADSQIVDYLADWSDRYKDQQTAAK